MRMISVETLAGTIILAGPLIVNTEQTETAVNLTQFNDWPFASAAAYSMNGSDPV